MAPSLRWERNSGLLGSLEGGFAICTVISGKVPTYSMFAFKPLYNMKLVAWIKEGLTLFLGRNCVKPLPAPAAIAHIQGWAKEMELSWEKVSALLQPATAGHARLVLNKTVPFFCTTLYSLNSAQITCQENPSAIRCCQMKKHSNSNWLGSKSGHVPVRGRGCQMSTDMCRSGDSCWKRELRNSNYFCFVRFRGHQYMTSAKFWDFWTPSPHVRIWDWSTVLNSRNLPYYIFFWANPPSPLSADVIYGCPLRACTAYWLRDHSLTCGRGYHSCKMFYRPSWTFFKI